ncbi:MAG: glycoside hydrolase family 16 protein [Flavobacteriales bacterium]|jgi:beta-glucanase (GH16 family)|nr:glycoside hydrolase family 16 protein [Flavobacteriales bacterium]
MKPLKIHILLFVLLLSTSSGTVAQSLPIGENYHLVFNDEFSDSLINTDKWEQKTPWNTATNLFIDYYDDGTIKKIYELAYHKWRDQTTDYRPDTTNCKVSNGTVKLYTRKENYDGNIWVWAPCYANGITIDGDSCDDMVYGPGEDISSSTGYRCFVSSRYLPYKYTTGMLFSKKSFKYGYFEIRFRLPPPPTAPKRHIGFGPNFWLYSADKDGSNFGYENHWSEIDIFEIGYDQENNLSNLYTTNVHYRPIGSASSHISKTGRHGYISSNEWHTAGMLWTSSEIEFYLDGVKIRDFEQEISMPTDSLVPMPLWIDIYSPNRNFGIDFDTLSTNGTAFPYVYELDYVRVYQLKQACEISKQYCSVFDASTYDEQLYKNIEFGGLGCQLNLDNSEEVTFMSAEDIVFHNQVELKPQATTIFGTHICEPYDLIPKIEPDTTVEPPLYSKIKFLSDEN